MKIPDRLVGPQQVATGPTTVFTAPAGGSLVRWVRVSNPSGGAVTFTMSVGADAAATRVYNSVSIAAGQPFFDYPYLELDEGNILQVSSDTNNVLVLTVGGDELGEGAASYPGVGRVLGPFPFAFDDVGLEDGIAFYTPTVGDILLDAWIEVDTAFDGTTPQVDVGTGVGTNVGLFSANGPIALDGSDSEALGTGVLLNTSSANFGLVNGAGSGKRFAPAKFTAANPLLVWASQNGQQGGTAVGGTAGSGAVYLVVSTPTLDGDGTPLMQSVRVDITSAQLKTLLASPVTLVPAQGAGTVIVPITAVMFTEGGTPYTGPTLFEFNIGTEEAFLEASGGCYLFLSLGDADRLGAVSKTRYFTPDGLEFVGTTTNVVNKDLMLLRSNPPELADGTGGATLFVTYFVVTP